MKPPLHEAKQINKFDSHETLPNPDCARSCDTLLLLILSSEDCPDR